MAAPAITEVLKYANLQLAAEALYRFDAKKDPSMTPGDPLSLLGHYKAPLTADILTTGNLHASRFAPTEAEKFVQQWTVVDHLSNTPTGFSGTLFQALKADPSQGIKAGDYVLSFRSTEFIDDTARDCVATNGMEIKSFGWAFGQIADMEAWYAQLKAGSLAGQQVSVTGYSLGGHLATAFSRPRSIRKSSRNSAAPLVANQICWPQAA